MKPLLRLTTIALALTATTLSAGVVNKDLISQLAATPAVTNSDPNRSSIRCWQRGTLLFEEVNWKSTNISKQAKVASFKHNTLKGQTLSLIDLGETICLYRKVNN